MKSILAALMCSIMLSFSSIAQTIQTAGPSSSGIISNVIYVPSLADQLKDGTFIPADNTTPNKDRPKMRGANNTIPGKGFPKGVDPLAKLQRSSLSYPSKEPLLVFDADENSPAGVTDPTGCVGPNHYLAAWNSGFRIFDKEGNPLVPEASLGSVLTGNTLGDPIVLYDKWADRYIITEFDGSPNGFEMAISEGPDPVNDGWYVYLNQFTTGQFPDYTKFSIWSDGYYVTANISNGSNADKVWVVERDPMLNGSAVQYVGFPLTGMATSGFYSPQAFNVTGGELPSSGNATIVYMQDDSWGGISDDHLKLWNINVDWDNTASSTISGPTQLTTQDFHSVFDGGSFSNFEQPSGPDVDGLQATVMNQAQFRKFPDHNSAVFNFLVDADGTSGELGAIRWYELRQDADGMPWSIYQEGTYVSPNGLHAFSGSMAMDQFGDIGMGYTTVSSEQSIAIQYTGRYANDPLNVMTIDESLIAQGSNNNPGNRLADYVHLTVDPSDELSFWHIAEYFNPGRDNVVGVFKLASELATDVGVISIDSPTDGEGLSSDETITVTLRNFGMEEQSNIPVSVQINGGPVISETYTEIIEPYQTAQYSFMATGDFSTLGLTYTIDAVTTLDGDQDDINNGTSTQVTHLDQNDIGVSMITEPAVDDNLPNEEDVTVIIQNFGVATQENFDVSFTVNGGTPITETVWGPLEPLETLEYTFTQQADLDAIGDFEITCFTSLASDVQVSNDGMTTIISKFTCQPESNCAEGDGIRHLILEGIDNISDCAESGYSTFYDQVASLEQGNTYDMTVTTEHGSQFFRAWIDFNDSFSFTTSETVLGSTEIAPGEGPGTFTAILPIEIGLNDDPGEHLMRVKTNRDSNVSGNPCIDMDFGETEDYKVIIGSVGLLESILGPNDIEIRTLANEQFVISLDSEVNNDPLVFSLMDTQGRTVVYNWIYPVDGVYTYELDMSYAAAGMYLIRIGDQRGGKIARITVQ